jgi:hypothetical protein
MYILNEGDKVPACTTKDGEHQFVVQKRPANFQSGWHEDKCEICGVVIGYDTSD